VENELSYREDIFLDTDSLDMEWTRQSSLFCKYSELYANAAFERDTLKEKVEYIKAEVALDIRENPEAYGLSKVTEGSIKELVTINQKVTDITDELLLATKNANILYGVKCAFEHKKAALESLGRLYVSGYFGDPKVESKAKAIIAEEASSKNAEKTLTKSPRMMLRAEKRKK